MRCIARTHRFQLIFVLGSLEVALAQLHQRHLLREQLAGQGNADGCLHLVARQNPHADARRQQVLNRLGHAVLCMHTAQDMPLNAVMPSAEVHAPVWTNA